MFVADSALAVCAGSVATNPRQPNPDGFLHRCARQGVHDIADETESLMKQTTMTADQATLPIRTPGGPELAYVDASLADRRRPLVDLLLRVTDLKMILSIGAGFTVFFLNAVQGAMLARMLGPTIRGEYSTAVFYTQLLTYVGLLGTQLAIARRAANTTADRRLARPFAWDA